ncbi:MAG: hypothetical protein LBO00_06205 [Zoogloeaceae bacterium]|nr:hypothetical protein [Zoogloeaceae bacterium]
MYSPNPHTAIAPFPRSRHRQVALRRTPLFTAILAGLAFFGSSLPLYAADDAEVEALKAEIQRLRQELATERGEGAQRQQPGQAGSAAQPRVTQSPPPPPAK